MYNFIRLVDYGRFFDIYFYFNSLTMTINIQWYIHIFKTHLIISATRTICLGVHKLGRAHKPAGALPSHPRRSHSLNYFNYINSNNKNVKCYVTDYIRFRILWRIILYNIYV